MLKMSDPYDTQNHISTRTKLSTLLHEVEFTLYTAYTVDAHCWNYGYLLSHIYVRIFVIATFLIKDCSTLKQCCLRLPTYYCSSELWILQCGNYGNSLTKHFFFVKVTVTKYLLKSWFDEIFLWWDTVLKLLKFNVT